MFFDINQRRYQVQIAGRPLILNGQPCRARLDRACGIIWLSDQLARDRRRTALFHELRHLWIDTHGTAKSAEDDADQAAAMMDYVHEAYLQQGGDAVLESLDPLPDKQPNRGSGSSVASEAACGYCSARVAVGSIGNDPPAWNEDLNCWIRQRGFLCGECTNKVTTWFETCSANGMPLGTIVSYPPPRVISGAEAAEWIERHQEICKVMVA